MLGRWHGMNGQGFAISESNDAKALSVGGTRNESNVMRDYRYALR